MNELDRIYEEIKRLFEAKDVLYNATKNSEINKDLINKLENNFNCKFDYIGRNGQVVFKDNETNESRPLKKDNRGYIIAQKYDNSKGQQTRPQKDENATLSFMNNILEQTSPTQPTPAPAAEQSTTTLTAEEEAAKAKEEEPTDGQQNGIVPAGNKGIEPYQGNEGGVPTTTGRTLLPSNIFDSADIQTLSSGVINYFSGLNSDIWESGEWKNFCDINEENYYIPKNCQNRARLSLNTENKNLPKEVHILLKTKENSIWYKIGEYEFKKGWILETPPQEVSNIPTEQKNSEKDIVDVEAKFNDTAQAALNTNTQLNYRLKSVIDSPDIQKQIDASPNGINYVGINGDKISLITMGESLDSPIEIPSFLLNKLTEAKEVEISSLGAGGQTNLNVFLTPEIQEYLKSQKGNPNITKVMLGKDGLVWLMDDKNNPYLLNDMKVNDNVPAKDQKDNSVNVFINNGGAGNNGNGGNGQNTNADGDGNGNGGDGPSGEATGIVSRAEILAIKNTMAERVKNAVNSIKLDEVNNALKEYNTQINFTQLQLSKPLDGTYINDNSDWQSFTIKEANENGAQEQKAEKKEETTPQQTTTGDPENYIIGKFTLTPIEGENKTQQGEGQEESTEETPENNSEEPTQDTQSNKRNNWEDVLREAQELLKRVREEENPEAEEGAEEAAESDEEQKKVEEEAKKKEEEKNQVLQKCFMLSLVKASEAVAEALGTIKLQRKTNDQTTFTGRKTEETVFSFTPGQQKNFGWKKLDDNTFKCWFSVMIIKNGTTDTAGTKFNRIMNKVAGAANVVNKLNAGVSYDKV